MNLKETELKGLFIVQPRVFEDARGYFYESFSTRSFQEHGLDVQFVQDNFSKSAKNVLRGLHFQAPPHAQGKLVQVIKGGVLDVAVDIRKSSPTYGQHFSLELNEQNKTMLYIPPGFAHGFLTLHDETIFAYKCTDHYHPESEASILWNDDQLGIDWGASNPTVSEKDEKGQAFADFQTPFID